MTFEEFQAEYLNVFRQMMKYSPSEIGAGLFAEKMAALADQHPEWAEIVENAAFAA